MRAEMRAEKWAEKWAEMPFFLFCHLCFELASKKESLNNISNFPRYIIKAVLAFKYFL